MIGMIVMDCCNCCSYGKSGKNSNRLYMARCIIAMDSLHLLIVDLIVQYHSWSMDRMAENLWVVSIIDGMLIYQQLQSSKSAPLQPIALIPSSSATNYNHFNPQLQCCHAQLQTITM